MSLVVDEHRQYLDDPVRLDAFDRAIRARVRPGDTVLDLASGTGILGLMACRAGAARVYSIESGGMIELARELAASNGYGDRVQFLKGHSLHVDLPGRVDLVLADQIGNFGFNAGVVEYFADAHSRFLAPGGGFLPSRLDLMVAPLESPALDAQVAFWDTRPAGFDFSPVDGYAANTGYQVELAPQELLGEAATLATLELGAAVSLIDAEAVLVIAREGTLHGIGGWFEVELAPGIGMTNSPLAQKRVRRRQIFFPLRPALPVRTGERVALRMRILPRDGMVTWRASVEGVPSRASGRHSTLQGMLLTREDLARTRPDSVPRLDRRGQARRTVVELCDGKRTLSAIEEQVWQRHRDQFATRREAEEFVAEVVTRYAI